MQWKTHDLRMDEKGTYLTIKTKFSSTHKPTAGSFSFAWVRALGGGRHISPSHHQCEDQHSIYIRCAGAEVEAIAYSLLRLHDCLEKPYLY